MTAEVCNSYAVRIAPKSDECGRVQLTKLAFPPWENLVLVAESQPR